MILDSYKGCLSRVYIWSPSIEVDSAWKPVKDDIRDHIKPSGREKCYVDSYDPAELEQVIHTHKNVIYYQRGQKHTDLHQIHNVIDDSADDTNFTRKSRLLHQLYIRGRHYMISTITPTQVYKQIPPYSEDEYDTSICLQIKELWRFRSNRRKMGAIYDKKTFLQIWHEAVSEDYSLLYVNSVSKGKRKMFMTRFNQYANPSSNLSFLCYYI